jgi:octaprenyl-diphosphate synthase
MKEMGENIGVAFQIKDDLLDYTGDGLTGKREGNDIKEKKITLPLIHALREAGPARKTPHTKAAQKEKKGSREIQGSNRFCKKHGGLEYAEQKCRSTLTGQSVF